MEKRFFFKREKLLLGRYLCDCEEIKSADSYIKFHAWPLFRAIA